MSFKPIRAAMIGSAAALAAAAAALPAAADAQRTAFEISMNGKPVGRHEVSVETVGAQRIARVSIDMKGAVGPFGFTYAHRCTEVYQGARLESLDCRDQEGRKERLVRVDDAPDAPPSSWWRADLMQADRMLDTRTGEVTPITVARIGEEVVATPDGPVPATRYRLKGTAAADVWYDAAGRWVKLAFKLRGQSFEYRKVTPLAAAPIA